MLRVGKVTLIKTLFSLLLFALLILPTGLTAVKAQAATKPSVDSTMYIATGSLDCEGYLYEKDSLQTLEVHNPVKKATYSFTTSKKDIVTVKSKGSRAYLTGVKAGTATVTCQQKLNGKTTKVGTCKVTVKNAEVSTLQSNLPMGTNSLTLFDYRFRNCNATYTFSSGSNDFVMKEYTEKEPAFNNAFIVKQSYTAKKPGTYTVTVNETYKGKTRVVGKEKLVIEKATVIDEETLYEQDCIGAYELIDQCRTDVNYFFEIGDNTIVELKKVDDGLLLNMLKAGTTTVKIYEDSDKADESKLIGTCRITVNELKVESIEADFSNTETYVGGDPIEINVYKEPENAPDKITVSSSNPKIAAVSEIDEDGYGEITPVSKGTVKITITCGQFTKTETIKIYADEDAMYEG